MFRAATNLSLPFRLLNAVGAVPGAKKLAGVKLGADALLQKATRQTGLTDFGNPGFLEGLQVLLTSVEQDARLHFVGRLGVYQVILDDLINRLLLAAAKKRTPALFSQPLVPPLIVLGLPRTGTTFLHRLLAEDSAHHAPRFWELAHPLPHPGKRDDRRLRAERDLGLRKRMTNDLDNKHFVTADAPEECMFMLASTFESMLFWVLAPVYGYLEWYLAQNRERKYLEYRSWLQVLQAAAQGRRLILKAPEHLGAVAALLRAVPEAQIVQTHRDPVTAFASFASLNLTTQGLATHDIDVQQNALANLHFLEEETRQNLLAREAYPKAVYDVYYNDLIADPVATVRGIYQHYGLELTDDFQRDLERYIRENPQGKHGRHRYAVSEHGLSGDVVRERFAAYNERFGFTS